MQPRRLRDGTEMDVEYFWKMAYECLMQELADQMKNESGESLSIKEAQKALLSLAREAKIFGDAFVSEALIVNKALGPKTSLNAAHIYFLQATVAIDDGNTDLAWGYLCDAFYFTGFFNGVIGALSPSYLDRKVDVSADLLLIEEDVQGVVRSQDGKSGGDSTSKKFNKTVLGPLFDLLEKLRPAERGWQSVSAAADDIYNHIQQLNKTEESKTIEWDWARNRSRRSIYEHLLANQDRFDRLNKKSAD